MDIIKLKSRVRSGRGKSYTRKARSGGWIPAVCYGQGQQAEAIEIDARDFGRIVRAKQTTHLIDLGLGDGGVESPSVIKEMQRDVLRHGHFVHVDFQRVSMTEKITVTIPVEVVGVPVGVKEGGGILEHPAREISLKCLPSDIPEKITVDVAKLGLGDSVHIRDLQVANAEILDSPDEVVAAVSVPAKEVALEAATEAEAAEGEGAAEGGEAAAGGGAAESKES